MECLFMEKRGNPARSRSPGSLTEVQVRSMVRQRVRRMTRLGLGAALVCCCIAVLPVTASVASWTGMRLVPNAGFEEQREGARAH